jgi:maleate isomerase
MAITAADIGIRVPPEPSAQRHLGVVAPFDLALDRELWRWTPDDVSLHLARTPFYPLHVGVEMAATVSDVDDVREATRILTPIEPEAVAYACASGSFVGGLAGEEQVRLAMHDGGAIRAVTTSGALLQAMAEVGATRVAIATPYVSDVTDHLVEFLAEAGIETVSRTDLRLEGRIWTVPYARTEELIIATNHIDAEAIFVSCTNLATYDLIARAEAALGKPVLSANQVTMWAALAAIGRTAIGPGQRLLERSELDPELSAPLELP